MGGPRLPGSAGRVSRTLGHRVAAGGGVRGDPRLRLRRPLPPRRGRRRPRTWRGRRPGSALRPAKGARPEGSGGHLGATPPRAAPAGSRLSLAHSSRPPPRAPELGTRGRAGEASLTQDLLGDPARVGDRSSSPYHRPPWGEETAGDQGKLEIPTGRFALHPRAASLLAACAWTPLPGRLQLGISCVQLELNWLGPDGTTDSRAGPARGPAQRPLDRAAACSPATPAPAQKESRSFLQSSPFPALPTPQVALLLYSLSRKYPEPLPFRDARAEVCPPLSWLGRLADRPGRLGVWLAVQQPRGAWLGTNCTGTLQLGTADSAPPLPVCGFGSIRV
nr:uncharacterized protein LOC132430578 [Delphinus delphis]